MTSATGGHVKARGNVDHAVKMHYVFEYILFTVNYADKLTKSNVLQVLNMETF